MDFPSYNQFTSFSQYILVLKIYTGYLEDRGYDDERIAEELFSALVHEELFSSFLHKLDRMGKAKGRIWVTDIFLALEQCNFEHAFSTPMERFQRLQWLEGEELDTFYQ